ncbi:MAG: hypothetical protein WCO54_06470 [Bacteroidota bacterium]
MKRIVTFLTILIFASCIKKSDCGGNDVIECNGNDIGARNNLGFLILKDSSKVWLNEDTLNQLDYLNNNGHSTPIKFTNKTIKNILQPYIYGDSVYSSPCCPVLRDHYTDYGTVQSEQLNFKGLYLPYNFSLIRQSVINTPKNIFDSTHKFTGYDVFSIQLNNINFPLPFNNPSAKFYNYYDSLNLNGQLFYHVYKVFVDPLTVNPNSITVNGAYYSLSKGMIGFYLTNGETWIKK